MPKFRQSHRLKEIILPNSSTPRLNNTQSMFKKCENLQQLDLRFFTTSSVNNMSYMFDTCSKLTTIIASNSFVTTNVTTENSVDMFSNCNLLVGGSGTSFNSSHINKDYAHIDGGTSNPGYFTAN